jgi:flagellar hook-associated protein 2
MTSSKNTISGAVAGLNFELKKVTEVGSPVVISVSRDEDGVAKKINDIIEQYNFMLKYSNEQTKYDSSGETPVKGTLFGDSTVKSVVQTLRGVFQSQIGTFDGSSFSTLSQLGITTDKKTGELLLDKDKLKEAMDKDFDGVVSVFTTKGTSSNSSMQYGRSSADTQEGEYELEEADGTFRIRKKGDTAWTVGQRSGDIISFVDGPAKGLMITAPEGSGNGTLTFSKGIAGRMEEKIKQYTDSVDGVVAKKKESLQARTRTIDSQIEREQRRVDAYRDRLVKQFAAMENTMQMLKSQQSAMFSQLGS